jgi:hypothetical protein
VAISTVRALFFCFTGILYCGAVMFVAVLIIAFYQVIAQLP